MPAREFQEHSLMFVEAIATSLATSQVNTGAMSVVMVTSYPHPGNHFIWGYG